MWCTAMDVSTFLSCIAAVGVSPYDREQLLYNGEGRWPSSVLLAALFSLRRVRALSVYVFHSSHVYFPRSVVASMLQPLQHFSRLTSLHIEMSALDSTAYNDEPVET